MTVTSNRMDRRGAVTACTPALRETSIAWPSHRLPFRSYTCSVTDLHRRYLQHNRSIKYSKRFLQRSSVVISPLAHNTKTEPSRGQRETCEESSPSKTTCACCCCSIMSSNVCISGCIGPCGRVRMGRWGKTCCLKVKSRIRQCHSSSDGVRRKSVYDSCFSGSYPEYISVASREWSSLCVPAWSIRSGLFPITLYAHSAAGSTCPLPPYSSAPRATLCSYQWSVHVSADFVVPVARAQVRPLLTVKHRFAHLPPSCISYSVSPGSLRCFRMTAPVDTLRRSTSTWPRHFKNLSQSSVTFASVASHPAAPTAGVSTHCADRQTESATANLQFAEEDAESSFLTPPAMPSQFSPETFFHGEIEEDDGHSEFTSALWTSDVSTPERANLWLKRPVRPAAYNTNADDELSRPHSTSTDQALPCATRDAGNVGLLASSRDELALTEDIRQQQERLGGHRLPRERKGEEAPAQEAHDELYEGNEEFEEDNILAEDKESDILNPYEAEWDPHPLSRRSHRNAERAMLSPGSTLLSRLALAEREALVSLPRSAKKNSAKSEILGIGGETYLSAPARRAVFSREHLRAATEGDLQRLAFDRRHAPVIFRSTRRRASLPLADRRRYSQQAPEEGSLDDEFGSRKRMRVLDLDSVPAAVLHHSFMFLLAKHLPAEICMKVISRIATYRDTHTQLAYENLIRDLGVLLTKHYESCTATPHSLGPAFIAYLSRIVQTISIAWSVDYIRRYGCFSKKFIAQQIERSTNPRLFDCVRYERHGGVKPLPPIITHPHRLSSYVRLLDECSAKFYMYTHLKRHGQIPMQHQLKHILEDRVRPEIGEVRAQIPYCESSPNHDSCSTPGESKSSLCALSAASSAIASNEVDHRLPDSFIAAEKMLHRSENTRRSRSSMCTSDGTSGSVESRARRRSTGGRRGASARDDCSACRLQKCDGSRYQEKVVEKVDSKGELITAKRPAMYDVIIAAEHLGIDYRQLLKQEASTESHWSNEVQKKGEEREALSVVLDGEDADSRSEEEEDAEERELRDLLVDDEQIYSDVLHRYIRRTSSFAGANSEDQDGKVGEARGADVLRENQAESEGFDEAILLRARGFLRESRGTGTRCWALGPETEADTGDLRAADPASSSAEIVAQNDHVCKPFDAGASTTATPERPEEAKRQVEATPLFRGSTSLGISTDVRRCGGGSAHPAAAHSRGPSTIQSQATFRMQNTFVVPPAWLDRNSQVNYRRKQRASVGENALVPRTGEPIAETQWGWAWNLTGDDSGASRTLPRIEEEGSYSNERWWGTSWGRNRAFFRFKGKAYALIPGQGWKQVGTERRRLLKPKKRHCKRVLKRERQMEKKIRLRRVREELLEQEVHEGKKAGNFVSPK